MNRFVLALPLILFASLAAADSPRRLTVAEQAGYLHRNLGLIRSVVGNGLSLAREDDRLKRADACSSTAVDLCHEIQQAADAGESARAAELALLLRKLLTQGVADNLAAAHAAVEQRGSSQEQLIQKSQERIVGEVRALEDNLPSASSDDDLERTIQSVREGRTAVEKAVTWPKKETEK